MINNRKVYALLIEARDAIFLSAQYATSLEQALAQAKKEYQRINHLPDMTGLDGAKIGLFTIKTVNELVDENKNFKEDLSKLEGILPMVVNPIPINKTKITINPEIEQLIEASKKDTPENKNKLMKKIINSKDFKMFEENKELFSKNEVKYIEEHLKG